MKRGSASIGSCASRLRYGLACATPSLTSDIQRYFAQCFIRVGNIHLVRTTIAKLWRTFGCVAERPVKHRRKFCGVTDDAGFAEAGLIESGAYGSDTSIHHVAWSDHIRTGLDVRSLSTLAEAGAFECFGASRRHALWQVRGLLREREASIELTAAGRKARFAGLTPIEQIAWDYRTSSHSSRAHPLALLRSELTRQHLPDARSLSRLRNGARVRYAGLVICRQRPGTASGVTFMTLEDETGFVNLVIWDRVFQAHATIVKTAHWLGVTGTVESQSGVVHVIAQRLWIPSNGAPEHGGSRDFH